MWLLDRLFGESEPECTHGRATRDDEHWYTLVEREGDTYWCEHDATYVKLRAVSRTFVCRYCGEIETWSTGEEVGGPEGLIRKADVEAGIVERPERDTGAWKGIDRRSDQRLDEELKEVEERRGRRRNRKT